jgi:hypothetical protein
VSAPRPSQLPKCICESCQHRDAAAILSNGSAACF